MLSFLYSFDQIDNDLYEDSTMSSQSMTSFGGGPAHPHPPVPLHHDPSKLSTSSLRHHHAHHPNSSSSGLGSTASSTSTYWQAPPPPSSSSSPLLRSGGAGEGRVDAEPSSQKVTPIPTSSSSSWVDNDLYATLPYSSSTSRGVDGSKPAVPPKPGGN